MNNKTVTSGQFFTLLFAGRAALTLTYSSSVSGVENAGSFILPLIALIPAAIILSLPAVSFSRKNDCGSFCSYASERLGTFGKVICVAYCVYFVFSAFFSLVRGFEKTNTLSIFTLVLIIYPASDNIQ